MHFKENDDRVLQVKDDGVRTKPFSRNGE
jgi:hypothetical protein